MHYILRCGTAARLGVVTLSGLIRSEARLVLAGLRHETVLACAMHHAARPPTMLRPPILRQFLRAGLVTTFYTYPEPTPGRDGGRQPCALAGPLCGAAPACAVRFHAGLPWQGAARGRSDPCDRRSAGGPIRAAAERGRPGEGVKSLHVGWHWAGELTHHQAVGDRCPPRHLLYNERRARAGALVAQAASPGRVHLPGAPAALPAANHPIDAGQVGRDRFQQRLARKEARPRWGCPRHCQLQLEVRRAAQSCEPSKLTLRIKRLSRPATGRRRLQILIPECVKLTTPRRCSPPPRPRCGPRASYYRDKYNRLHARRGPVRAIMAVAHKLLVAAFHMLSTGETFRDLGEGYLDQIARKRSTSKLVQRRVWAASKVGAPAQLNPADPPPSRAPHTSSWSPYTLDRRAAQAQSRNSVSRPMHQHRIR